MFHGPHLIVSTMQEKTTPIFKRLWYDWTQQQPGVELTNPLGQCWVPPIVAFYDQQGLLRTYSLPGSSIRSLHSGSPRGHSLVGWSWQLHTVTFYVCDCHDHPMREWDSIRCGHFFLRAWHSNRIPHPSR